MAQLAAAAVMGGAKLYQAKKAKELKDREALAYLEAADRTRAAAHQEAREEQRNADYAYSRALAVAAASGGGVDNPGVTKLLSDLAAEGQYRVMSRLYAGDTEAKGLEFRAGTAKKEGRNIKRTGYLQAATTAFSTYQGFGS